MDSTLTHSIARSIPTAESGAWPLFAGLVLVAWIATLSFGPRALASYRRLKFAKNPEIERRAPATPGALHEAAILRLEARVADQEDELAEVRNAVRAGLAELRSFIDAQFAADRVAAQNDRISLEDRISSRFDSLTQLIAGKL